MYFEFWWCYSLDKFAKNCQKTKMKFNGPLVKQLREPRALWSPTVLKYFTKETSIKVETDHRKLDFA